MFLKRAFYSMKYRKGQNIALTIAYTVLFALTLGLLLVYLSMSSQVDYLQKSLGGAVTMRGMEFYVQNSWGGRSIRPEDAVAFVDSPYVETYNYVASTAQMDLENDVLPVVRDSNRGFYEYAVENHTPGYKYVRGYGGDCTMVPVSNSRYYDAFTIYGFKLVEGNHFTPEDGDVVLISVELAQRNGLKVGDQITFSTGNIIKQEVLESEDDIQYATLTISGLFESPQAGEMGYDNESIHEDPANLVISAYDATSGVCSWRTKQPSAAWVTVYLKSPSDMDAFLEETREKLTIERVAGSQSGYGRELMTTEERKALEARYDESPFYTLYLDDEWYDTVAKPVESVRALMGAFLAVVLVGSAVVLGLVVVLSLRGRKREFGILLAMGEAKRKIIGQIFVEVFLPLLLAAVIGMVLGTRVFVPLAEDYASSLLSVQSREEQTDWRSDMKGLNEDFMHDMKRMSYYLYARSPRTIAVVDSVPYAAGPEVYSAYFGLDFGMVLLILLMQLLSVLRVKPARILTRRE